MRFPRFRLSLRVMLLLVLAFGLGLGWLVNRARNQRLAVAQVSTYNGYVLYDFEQRRGKQFPDSQPWGPAWLRRRLGNEYFQEVTVVRYVDQPPSDATLAPLESLSNIEELAFLNRIFHGRAPVEPPPDLARLTEPGLSRLERLTRLRRLEIHGQELSGSMLRHLRYSPDLEELDLMSSGITDEGMPPLGAMPRLRVLKLWESHIIGTCLEGLRGSQMLQELEFYETPLADPAYGCMGTLTNLDELYFNQCETNDAQLAHLSGLVHLKRLTLGGYKSKITDAGLVHLEGMTELESLDLTGAQLQGSGLAALKGLTKLKRLRLGWTHVDDDSLKALASMPDLEVLELHQTRVTDAGLKHLQGLKNLKELSLFRTAVTKEALDGLNATIPGLR